MCDVEKNILKEEKNIKGMCIISFCNTECPLVPPNVVLFQATFQKVPFWLFLLNRAKWTHFTERSCSTETAVRGNT